jgi:hypothetical protein
MTVFTGDDIGGQHQPGVEHDQCMAGQGGGAHGPQLLDPMLGAGEVIAVEDSSAIAGEPVWPGPSHRVDDRGQPRGHGVDQRGGDGGLGAVERVVDGVDGRPDGLGACLKGGMDRGPETADHDAHEVDDHGEEELVGELLAGDLLEELVEDLGVHGVGHDALSHDGQGRNLGEPLEGIAEDHRCRLRGESVTPYLVAA